MGGSCCPILEHQLLRRSIMIDEAILKLSKTGNWLLFTVLPSLTPAISMFVSSRYFSNGNKHNFLSEFLFASIAISSNALYSNNKINNFNTVLSVLIIILSTVLYGGLLLPNHKLSQDAPTITIFLFVFSLVCSLASVIFEKERN